MHSLRAGASGLESRSRPELKIGDSLRRKIEDGLARCKFGFVIISPNFLNKEWPQRELDGLVALEVESGKTKILPIWHQVDRDLLLQRSPVLADRLAGKSSEGVEALATEDPPGIYRAEQVRQALPGSANNRQLRARMMPP